MKAIKIPYEKIIERMQNCACPVCGVIVHEYGNIEISSCSAHQRVSCDNCGTVWTEYYSLTGIEIEETVDQEIKIENDLSSVENIPEILNAILNMKKILPALLGIDENLDRIIAERLKEKKDA